MQAYHAGDQPAYVYAQPPNQYVQPQTAYYPQYAQYPQYFPPAPQAQPQHSFPTYAASYDPPPQQFPTPAPRRRNLSRSGSSTPGPPATGKSSAPLKSAMKKKKSLDRSASGGGVPLSRYRTSSDPRPRVNSQTRQRPNAGSQFVPEHLFLSLHGSNEIRVENIAYQSLLDELRENLVTMWPYGIISDDSRQHRWRLQFAGSPWLSTGNDFLFAGRLLCQLFTVLANSGYSYLTTVNTGKSTMPPRLVFTNSQPDHNAYFFLIALSPSGEKMSLLDAPPEIAQQLSMSLRAAFPHSISSDRSLEDGLHIIQMRRGRSGPTAPELDKGLFISFMLRYLNSAGFKLDGSLTMGKRNFFGFGSRKEVWIFRGTTFRPESRQSHRSRQE